MKLGKVVGKVWATQRDPQLKGVKLYVLQQIDTDLKPVGKPFIAIDAVGSGEGEIVFYVNAREACYALQDRPIPSDASIVGILDSLHANPVKAIEEFKKRWLKQRMIAKHPQFVAGD